MVTNPMAAGLSSVAPKQGGAAQALARPGQAPMVSTQVMPPAPSGNAQAGWSDRVQSVLDGMKSRMQQPAQVATPTSFQVGKVYDPNSYGKVGSAQTNTAIQQLLASNPNLQALVDKAASKGVVFDNGIVDPYKSGGAKAGDIMPTGNFVNGTFGGSYGDGIGAQAGGQILKDLIASGLAKVNTNGTVTSDKNLNLSLSDTPGWTNWTFDPRGIFSGTPTESVNLQNGNTKQATLGQIVAVPDGRSSATYANRPLTGWKSLVSTPGAGTPVAGQNVGQYGLETVTSNRGYVPQAAFDKATRLVDQTPDRSVGTGALLSMAATAMGAPPGTGSLLSNSVGGK